MWTELRTWTSGERVTASHLNVHHRDNMKWLYSPPFAEAVHDSNQTITVGGFRIVDFAKTLQDNDEMHGTGPPAGTEPETALFNINHHGIYFFAANLAFESSNVGLQRIHVAVRGLGGGWGAIGDDMSGTAGPEGPRYMLPTCGAEWFWQPIVNGRIPATGRQASVQCHTNNKDGAELVADWGAIPRFSCHWVGSL